MKALRLSQISSSSKSSPPLRRPSSSSSSSRIHLRSVLFVVACSNSSPASSSARGGLKSPWHRRKRKHILSAEQWRNLFTPDGRLRDNGIKFLKKVRTGGVDPSIRPEVWPFLLGVFELTSSKNERDILRTIKRNEYENLRQQCTQIIKDHSQISRLNESNPKGSADRYCSEGMDAPDSECVPGARDSVSSEDPTSSITHRCSDSKQDSNVASSSDSSVSVSSNDPEMSQTFDMTETTEDNDRSLQSKPDSPTSKMEVQSESCHRKDSAEITEDNDHGLLSKHDSPASKMEVQSDSAEITEDNDHGLLSKHDSPTSKMEVQSESCHREDSIEITEDNDHGLLFNRDSPASKMEIQSESRHKEDSAEITEDNDHGLLCKHDSPSLKMEVQSESCGKEDSAEITEESDHGLLSKHESPTSKMEVQSESPHIEGFAESIEENDSAPQSIQDSPTSKMELQSETRHIRDSAGTTEDNDHGSLSKQVSPTSKMEVQAGTCHREDSGSQTSDITEIKEDNDHCSLSKQDSLTSKMEVQAGSHRREDFATWQRIIRLDAVRANGEWMEYNPALAAVSDAEARHAAEVVGLTGYEHLDSGRIFHSSRLLAILEAYALYDPEIGYCQGMSDLLSPIIAVMTEDHEAFWCFVGFMKKARHNFRLDEVGIRRQLNLVSKIIKYKDSHLYRHLEKLEAEDCFFVYRMVVVLFRRELTFEQTLCLWEVMWADQAALRAGVGKSAWDRIRQQAPPTEDLLLYAIAASVLQRRKQIIERYSSMDEILRECNSMAGHLDVWKLLDDAHGLVVMLNDKIEAPL